MTDVMDGGFGHELLKLGARVGERWKKMSNDRHPAVLLQYVPHPVTS